MSWAEEAILESAIKNQATYVDPLSVSKPATIKYIKKNFNITKSTAKTISEDVPVFCSAIDYNTMTFPMDNFSGNGCGVAVLNGVIYIVKNADGIYRYNEDRTITKVLSDTSISIHHSNMIDVGSKGDIIWMSSASNAIYFYNETDGLEKKTINALPGAYQCTFIIQKRPSASQDRGYYCNYNTHYQIMLNRTDATVSATSITYPLPSSDYIIAAKIDDSYTGDNPCIMYMSRNAGVYIFMSQTAQNTQIISTTSSNWCTAKGYYPTYGGNTTVYKQENGIVLVGGNYNEASGKKGFWFSRGASCVTYDLFNGENASMLSLSYVLYAYSFTVGHMFFGGNMSNRTNRAIIETSEYDGISGILTKNSNHYKVSIIKNEDSLDLLYHKNYFVYDFSTNELEQVSTLPYDFVGSAVKYNGQLHIIGGDPEPNNPNSMAHYMYNENNQIWEKLSDCPIKPIQRGVCVCNNKIYAISRDRYCTYDGEQWSSPENPGVGIHPLLGWVISDGKSVYAANQNRLFKLVNGTYIEAARPEDSIVGIPNFIFGNIFVFPESGSDIKVYITDLDHWMTITNDTITAINRCIGIFDYEHVLHTMTTEYIYKNSESSITSSSSIDDCDVIIC